MQTDHGISQTDTKLPIVEIDDFDIDGLGFKPINKGLGFHGERETSVQKRSIVIDRKERAFNNQSSKRTSLHHVSEKVTLDNPLTGIEQFYSPMNKEQVIVNKKKDIKKEVVSEDARLISRLCAFILDCAVVFSSSLIIFGFFVLTLYSAVGSSLIKSFVIDNIDFFMILNGVIYIIYFTLWDGVGSLGKVLMGIEVVPEKESDMLTITQLFNRTILSMFGLFLFFIPNILDAHTKLSRTKTVERR